MSIAATDDPRFRAPQRTSEEVLTSLGAQELMRHFRALQDVTEAVLAHLSLQELLDELLDRLQRALSVDAASILLCSADGTSLVVRASRGLADDGAVEPIAIPMGEGIAGAVAVRRSAVIIDEVARLDPVRSSLRRLASMMVAPLLVQGEILGVLKVGTDRARRFTDAELHLLQVVADRAALAIKNALLYDRAQAEIEARARDEAALVESETRFRTMADHAPVLIWMAGADGKLTFFNRPWLEFTGRTMQSEVGEGWNEGIHPEDFERRLALYRDHFERREPFRMEYRLRRHDGEYRWVLDSAVPLRDADGTFVGFIGSCTDIHDQHAQRDALEAHAAQLQDLTVELEHTVDTLQQRTDEAEAARREADRANRAKSNFVAAVSHELRTPLNAVIGYSDLLLAGVPEPIPSEATRQVERIVSGARHLLGLIDELLSFTRLEAGRERFQVETVALRDLAHGVGAMVEPMASARGLRLHVRAPGPSAMIHTDATKARQVLLNLLDNAVKFTHQGSVELRVTLADGYAVFAITDTGPGISRENLERIFELFTQVEEGLTRPAAGLGLGLALSRRIAAALGGEIRVESRPGKGSVFSLLLPIEPPASLQASMPAA
jgi:PAS domain S-box-containing protein